MSKNGLRGYITLAIIFAVFSVISFAVPFSKTSVFWAGYVFAVISIAYQIYVFKISFSSEGDVKSKFYGFPIAKIGVIYLIVQIIVSIIEMAVAALIPFWIVLIINVIILAVALIGCIAADVMRDEIVRQDVKLKKDVSTMRSLQSLSASIVGLCNDEEMKTLSQKIADEFKYSDPVSSEQTKVIESELLCQMNELQRAVMENDSQVAKELFGRVVSTLSERNRLCALNK